MHPGLRHRGAGRAGASSLIFGGRRYFVSCALFENVSPSATTEHCEPRAGGVCIVAYRAGVADITKEIDLFQLVVIIIGFNHRSGSLNSWRQQRWLREISKMTSERSVKPFRRTVVSTRISLYRTGPIKFTYRQTAADN